MAGFFGAGLRFTRPASPAAGRQLSSDRSSPGQSQHTDRPWKRRQSARRASEPATCAEYRGRNWSSKSSFLPDCLSKGCLASPYISTVSNSNEVIVVIKPIAIKCLDDVECIKPTSINVCNSHQVTLVADTHRSVVPGKDQRVPALTLNRSPRIWTPYICAPSLAPARSALASFLQQPD